MFTTALLAIYSFGFVPTVWRNYEEVFDLAVIDGKVIAATNGGLLRQAGSRWEIVPAPGGLRTFVRTSPLVVSVASGRSFNVTDRTWLPSRPKSENAFVSADEAGDWHAPTLAHVYKQIRQGSDFFVGTSDGLFHFHGGRWNREVLPTLMPVNRPTGVACVDGVFVVGGMNGLYVGKPSAWRQVASDAIRQVARVGSDIWVVHGNGAMDKLDTANDRLYPDVMTGASMRPWTSCITPAGASLLCGGIGGWVEWGSDSQDAYPSELTGEVITAIAAKGDVRWVGTEQSGVFRFDAKARHQWNPGNGLYDSWVTSFCWAKDGLIVGTMHAGLYQIERDTIRPVNCPTKRVTHLVRWHGELVVGGMDGCWLQHGSTWKSLSDYGEETTSLSEVDGRLCVTTASGIAFF